MVIGGSWLDDWPEGACWWPEGCHQDGPADEAERRDRVDGQRFGDEGRRDRLPEAEEAHFDRHWNRGAPISVTKRHPEVTAPSCTAGSRATPPPPPPPPHRLPRPR